LDRRRNPMAHDRTDAQLRKAIIRLAHENPDGIRKHLLPLVKEAATPRWETVRLDAATLAAAQGVKFMYITPSGFGGFEAHRYRDPADGWAGQVLRAGSSYDWRRAKSYTDKRILRMFQSKGGMLGGSEGGPGEAYITRVSIW